MIVVLLLFCSPTAVPSLFLRPSVLLFIATLLLRRQSTCFVPLGMRPAPLHVAMQRRLPRPLRLFERKKTAVA